MIGEVPFKKGNLINRVLASKGGMHDMHGVLKAYTHAQGLHACSLFEVALFKKDLPRAGTLPA
jgi:hypothetical protein